jgi:hypothetical protein
MEKRKTDRITLWQELKSLCSSLIGITLNQNHYMESEYERASWRRVWLTIFTGAFITVIITQIIRFIIAVRLGNLSNQYLEVQREVFFRFWELGTAIAITVSLVFIIGYVARRLIVDEDYEVDKIYPLVSYVQIVAIIQVLRTIFITLFVNSALLIFRFEAFDVPPDEGYDTITTAIMMLIRIAVIIYAYFLLGRMLKIHFQAYYFRLRFSMIVLFFEGFYYVITTWIAPRILQEILRITYQFFFMSQNG